MPVQNGKETLRVWNDTHIEESFPKLKGTFENELFYGCELGDISEARFLHCDMSGSKVTTDRLEDVIGVGVSLECLTFTNVELSETAFLAFIALLLKTKGNTELRRKILEAVGKEKMIAILKQFAGLEL